MVAVFSHGGCPLLTMTGVPIGISGSIAGLTLLNLGGTYLDKIGCYPISQPFDMITMLGFLALVLRFVSRRGVPVVGGASAMLVFNPEDAVLQFFTRSFQGRVNQHQRFVAGASQASELATTAASASKTASGLQIPDGRKQGFGAA